jgi:hypothetical protein
MSLRRWLWRENLEQLGSPSPKSVFRGGAEREVSPEDREHVVGGWHYTDDDKVEGFRLYLGDKAVQFPALMRDGPRRTICDVPLECDVCEKIYAIWRAESAVWKQLPLDLQKQSLCIRCFRREWRKARRTEKSG